MRSVQQRNDLNLPVALAFSLSSSSRAADMVNGLDASVTAWIVTALLTTITILLGMMAWFLRREITNNDKAHDELRRDVKKLLEGDVAWVRILLERHGNRQP